jgi:flagellar biosynthesis protein FlhB
VSKSEQPTRERLRRALREGDVPLSAVAIRTAALFGAAAVLPAAARAVRSRFAEGLRAAVHSNGAPDAGNLAFEVLSLAAPLIAVAAVFAIVIGLAQTRGTVVFERMGSCRQGPTVRPFVLVDGRRIARAFLGAALVCAIACATVGALRGLAPDIARVLPSAGRALDTALSLAKSLGWAIAAILVTVCAADYAAEYAAWMSRLRMSPREIKDERREQEGDPAMRRARRRAHEAIAREPTVRGR